MKDIYPKRVFICFSILLCFFFLFVSPAMASEKYGIIIITDSSNPDANSISLDLEDYLVKLRDLNVSLGNLEEGIFWVKTYNYNDTDHADFIKSSINIPREQVPFVGISYLNPDRSFKSFLPKMKLANFKDPVNVTRAIFEVIRKFLDSPQKEKLISRLSGFKLLETTPSEATVYVDEKPVGKTPMKNLILAPGEHSVIIKKEGYEDIAEKGNIKEGTFENAKITMELRKGKVDVSTTPSGAAVIVDEVNLGTTPVTIKLKPGTYTLNIRKPGYKPTQKEVRLRSDSHISEEFTLEADKVKCFLDVRGYFAKIKIKNSSGDEEMKTFIVDQSLLFAKVKDLLEKQPFVELVPKQADARVTILFEVVPQAQMKFSIKIKDSKNAVAPYQTTLTGKLPVQADDEKLLEISARVFEAKFLEPLNKMLMEIKTR